MALHPESVKSLARWVVEVLSDGRARSVQVHRIATELDNGGFYGDEERVNSETFRNIVRYGEQLLDHQSAAVAPRPTEATATKLVRAICAYKNLDATAVSSQLGIGTATGSNGSDGLERPEPSQAFELISAFYDCQRPIAQVRDRSQSALRISGALEVDVTGPLLPSMNGGRYLVFVLHTASAPVLRDIAGTLGALDAEPYSAIMVLYDEAATMRSAILQVARDLFKGFVVNLDWISVQPVGEFLYQLFDNDVAESTLRAQYAGTTFKGNEIDPFDDRAFLEIDSEFDSSGADAGSSLYGDHLHAQLLRISQLRSPVRCMVRGRFGAGKTTAIYRVAASLIRSAQNLSADLTYDAFLEMPRPVIIPASEILFEVNVLGRLADALRVWYGLPISVDGDRTRRGSSFVAELIRAGVIVIFIDSLDESPALSQGDKISRLLESLPGYRMDQEVAGFGESDPERPDNRSKFIISYRPEIFQSGRIEKRLLYLDNFAIDELRDCTFTLTAKGPRESLKSPFNAEIISEAGDDPTSVVRVANRMFQSLGESPLFRAISQERAREFHDLRRHADEFAMRDGDRPQFLADLYSHFAYLADRWGSRESDRDPVRTAGPSIPDFRREKLEECAQIALAMLGREDCRAAPGTDGATVSYALPADELRKITEQRTFSSERTLQQLAEDKHKEEIQLTAWYDMRVGMMLVVEPDETTHDRRGRWRFPNIAMEAFFVAKGLFQTLSSLAGTVELSSIDYPFEFDAPLGPLCRAIIDDRQRGAVMLLAGKLLSERSHQARDFPDDVLRSLQAASAQGGRESAAAVCVSEHPVFTHNVVTICVWLKELLELGDFEADLSHIPLPGFHLRGWTWPKVPPPAERQIRRQLKVRETILEFSDINGFQLTGEPLISGSKSPTEILQEVEELVRVRGLNDDATDSMAERWSIIPGGIVTAQVFHANPDLTRPVGRFERRRRSASRSTEGGRETVQSIILKDADGAVSIDIFVPTFLMQQTPTSNAQFLSYLQRDGARTKEGWPLYERRMTSNPWYLYDWSHFEFLFGSDLEQWPTEKTAGELRELAADDFRDRDRLKKLVGSWIDRRRQQQERYEHAAGPDRWHLAWKRDSIERVGWLFSPKGPFRAQAEADVVQAIEDGSKPRDLLINILKMFEDWRHRPVTRLNWRVANRYARSKGWSLPTEAEFEAAAQWWKAIKAQVAPDTETPPSDMREISVGFGGGAELWQAIEAQLHAYLPNIHFTAPPWTNEGVRPRPFEVETASADPTAIFNREFLEVANAFRAKWPDDKERADRMMPPAYLTGVVGTWTRDVYDPSWPLSFARMHTDGGRATLFNPVNNGLVDAARTRSIGDQLSPMVAEMSDEPLRSIRGRGLRFGWPRGSDYRFGQQETNVNPDVGLRCVKRLHLI